MATGALDANGIWVYDEDDPVSPFSDYENLGQNSVSAQFTADRARLDSLETANTGDVALGTFSPTWTGLTIGVGGTSYAKFAVIKNVAHVFVRVTLGTSPTVADPMMSLPIAPATLWSTARAKLGYCSLTDDSAAASGQFEGTVIFNGGLARIGYLGLLPTALAWGAVDSTHPFTWAIGDRIALNLTYPTA